MPQVIPPVLEHVGMLMPSLPHPTRRYNPYRLMGYYLIAYKAVRYVTSLLSSL
jgi:hypothetical protein